MPSPKLVNRWGVLAKIETTPGTFNTPSASTDGFLVVERPVFETPWLHDGSRSHPSLKRVGRSGRGHTTSLIHEPAGAAAAYSATVLPSIHTIARMCGLSATIVTTAGSEKVTYAPAPTDGSAYAAGSLIGYDRGQEYHVTDAHGKFRFEAENGGIPRFTFDVFGISDALPVDATLPAITYAGAQAVDPTVATGMALAIGSWNPGRFKSIVVAQEMDWTPRYLDNVGKHGGFNPGEPTFTLEVTVESEALATYNPFQVAELATSGALTATFANGGNYRKFKWTAANAQLAELPEQDDANASIWALKFELKPSTFMGNDHLALEFYK